jgi:hypothetical protein
LTIDLATFSAKVSIIAIDCAVLFEATDRACRITDERLAAFESITTEETPDERSITPMMLLIRGKTEESNIFSSGHSKMDRRIIVGRALVLCAAHKSPIYKTGQKYSSKCG